MSDLILAVLAGIALGMLVFAIILRGEIKK